MTRPRGGYIGFNRVPAAAGANSAASGIWTLREAEANRRAGTWPRSPDVPEQISGLQLWLDAADSGTLFDATTGGSLVAADGGVARWEDKSGLGRHFTQATSGNRPVRKTSQQNGKDTLLFDGTNDEMIGSDFLDANTSSLVAFVVLRRNATGAPHEILTKATDTQGWYFGFTSTNTLRLYNSDDPSSTRVDTASSVSASSYSLIFMSVNAGDFHQPVYRRNGTPLSSGAATETRGGVRTPVNTSAAMRLGSQLYQGVFYYLFNGNIAEIVLYNAQLSDANRGLVESYLMNKWGIT